MLLAAARTVTHRLREVEEEEVLAASVVGILRKASVDHMALALTEIGSPRVHSCWKQVHRALSRLAQVMRM